MGHTRWATHGAPNDMNAHPHTDCTGNISIIHNGIIENYSAIRNILIEEGHMIKSETDSEVVAHLIEKFYDGNLKKTVKKALKLIEGTYGLAVMHKDHDEIIIARKGSPIVIGLCEHGVLVASDATPIVEHTKKVIYLKDGELAVIRDNECSIEDSNGIVIDNQIEEIKWSIDAATKRGYKHFMLKEIFEQPESLRNVLRGRIKQGRIKLTLNTDFSKEHINRIIILACGTSWHSGLIGKHLMEDITRIPVEVDYASEFRYRNPIITDKDLVIVISQSGETADTLAALREAKARGAKTLGIINVVGSTIAREVDSGIYLHAGPEIGVASTKAFTCQVTALVLLSLYIRQEKSMEMDTELIEALETLPERVEETLRVDGVVKDISRIFKDSTNFLFLGRDINFPVAIEGALKLKEISYIHAEGYPAAEMKHGPIALIDENMPVVFIATKNNLSDKIMSNIQEVKSRHGKVISIMNDESLEVMKLSDYSILIPQVHKFISPIINVIPLQLLAYHIADMKGLDIDKPRNLAKSVTVE
jgi:glucosamine--fructose-6-phosphate aminotransferase (isomerizing)